MTSKISSRGHVVASKIGNRETFNTHGALRAIYMPVAWELTTGQLDVDHQLQFNTDRPKIIYVVYSYSTPIAWVTKDDTVHIVDQRFSRTTSQHQGRLYLLK